MNVTLPVFIKHAEKVTKTAPAGRPVLNGVFYRNDGSIVVTDSHRLYLATDVHTQAEEVIQNPKTGANIEGNFPDVSRLIQEESAAKATVKLSNIDYHAKAVKAIQQVATIPERNGDTFTKKAKTMLSIENNSGKEIVLSSYGSGGKASYTVGLADEVDEPVKLIVNAEYLAQAIDVFKDTGVHDVTLRYYGSERPFTLTGGNMIALLLPIRSLKEDA